MVERYASKAAPLTTNVRSSMKKRIALCAIVAAAIIAGVFVWLRLPDPRIKQRSRELFAAKINGDAELIWSSACPELHALLINEHGSKEEVLKLFRQGKTTYASLEDWNIHSFMDLGDRATTAIELLYKNGMKDTFYLYLIKIDGEWMIHR